MSTTLEKGQTINFYQATTPIIISVFGVYLTIGITLGVLPRFVQSNLGLDSIIVGLVIGLQSLSNTFNPSLFRQNYGYKRSKDK